MPANTSPDNIQFPVAGDQIAPLNTVFQNLAQTTQTALTRRIVANVADFTALAALSTTGKLAGDLAFVVEGAVYMSWTGTVWRQTTTAIFASTTVRDTAYAKATAAFRVVRVRALDTSTSIESQWSGTAWLDPMPFTVLGATGDQGATTTATPLALTLEISDRSNMHDNATNNSRMIARVAGVYEISYNLYNNSGTGDVNVSARINGLFAIRGSRTTRTNTNSAGASVAATFSLGLALNDYVEIMVIGSAGSFIGGAVVESAMVTMKMIG